MNEEGICNRCKNERKSATEGSDYICDGCFDFLNGVSHYDPKTPNPVLEAVQEALWKTDDDDDDFSDNEDDPEDEYYSPEW
jgi:hypothetical protein